MYIIRLRTVALAVLVSTVLMLSIAYSWPIQDAYHPYNIEWNGCSQIANLGRNTKLFLSYNSPLPTGSSLLAIIGPSVEFSKKESSQIMSFLEAGGTVLLADDFGTGNSLLEALNLPARFSGRPLMDLLSYSKEPNFPLIIDFTSSPVTVNVTELIMNHPSYIDIGNSSLVTRLGSSSGFSFVDLDGDNKPGLNETVDSYPVLASVRMGKGLFVLASDPSMFVNDMIDLHNNMQLFRNILKIGQNTLFFDVAHLAKAPLTNERMILRDAINSIRNLAIYSRNGVYIQSLVVAILIIGFSFQILRRARKRNNQSLYSEFRLDLKR